MTLATIYSEKTINSTEKKQTHRHTRKYYEQPEKKGINSNRNEKKKTNTTVYTWNHTPMGNTYIPHISTPTVVTIPYGTVFLLRWQSVLQGSNAVSQQAAIKVVHKFPLSSCLLVRTYVFFFSMFFSLSRALHRSFPSTWASLRKRLLWKMMMQAFFLRGGWPRLSGTAVATVRRWVVTHPGYTRTCAEKGRRGSFFLAGILRLFYCLAQIVGRVPTPLVASGPRELYID